MALNEIAKDAWHEGFDKDAQIAFTFTNIEAL